MLEYLRIRDLALIQDVELEFSDGLNVLTGETGAGKSFILKALGFLMGDRLQRDIVRPGSERAVVEAVFSLPEQEFILRRELVAESGRSRFHMNDALCSQEIAQELRARLLLHTTQHGHQKLLQPAFHAALIDAALNRELLERRDTLLKAWRENETKKEELHKKACDLGARRELLEMQQQEIDKVAPKEGEEEELETRRAEAGTHSALTADYEGALNILCAEEGLGPLLYRLERILERLAAVSNQPEGRESEHFSQVLESVANLRAELPELEKRLRRAPSSLSRQEIDALEARLFALAQLKRKLRRSLSEILSLREEIEENLSFLDRCALDIKQIEVSNAELRKTLAALLKELTPARRVAGERFTRCLEEELIGLGFSEGLQVSVEFSSLVLLPGSQDTPPCLDERARLLWAPNPGQTPQALDRIASGGELSRFLLALVGIQAQEENATLIFDEVDAGIGGHTLMRLAERLEKLAGKRQILLITHWPQLAVRAKQHFLINKEILDGETFTRCKRLDAAEVKQELKRMWGGDGGGQ